MSCSAFRLQGMCPDWTAWSNIPSMESSSNGKPKEHLYRIRLTVSICCSDTCSRLLAPASYPWAKGYREWGGCGFCRNPVAARSRWFARASRFLVFSIVAVDGMCHSSGVVLAHKDSGPLPVPDVICVRSSRVFPSGRLCLTGGRLGVACPFGGVGRTFLCPR